MKELSLLHTLPPPQHSCTIHLLDRHFPEVTGMNIDPHLHVIDTGYHAIFFFFFLSVNLQMFHSVKPTVH